MHKKLCPNYRGLCDAMAPIDGEVLRRFLLGVHFTGEFFQFSKQFSFQLNCYMIVTDIHVFNIQLSVQVLMIPSPVITVKPAFKGHQREDVKFAAKDRWLLIQGSI